ncbi:hypothetical protein [Haloferula sargassicola]|uniref:Uncharacterized protein n=1 Tax=Haloferula sargassicola TaxID=490096 RepID=A0ABP9UNX8_9BACT
MKTMIDRCSAVGRFSHWIEVPSPPCSLAVGATCGCDHFLLEKEIASRLNRAGRFDGARFHEFDPQDIRQLAGDPAIRSYILVRAGLADSRYKEWNDYERVLRGLASIGGVVLFGSAAMDATHELPNVCRVMVGHCVACQEADVSARIEPHPHEVRDMAEHICGVFGQWLLRFDASLPPRGHLMSHQETEALLGTRNRAVTC